MKKIDYIFAIIIGEITALYFISAFGELVPKNFLSFYNWGLPVLFPVLSVIGIWISYLIGKKILVIFQIGKYLLSGVLATIIDLGILNLLIVATGIAAGLYYTIFKSISFIAATFVKFLISKFWTFEKIEKGKSLQETIQFFVVTLIGLAINAGTASIVVNVIGPQYGLSAKIWGNIGGIVAALVSFTWNFIGYKFIVFKK